MKFECDPQKSRINRDKHGITLEDAMQIWSAPAVQIQAKPGFDEARYMLVGKVGGMFYSCVFTMRGETIRLISARRSRKKEVSIYHEVVQKEGV